MLEVIFFFVLLMCQIWVWPTFQLLAAAPIIGIIISWYIRKDNLKTLGIVPEWPSKKLAMAMVAAFTGFWLIILICGMIWNPNFSHQVSQGVFWYKYAKMSLSYCFWALFQQLWLCGYFTNRVQTALNDNKKTILVMGILFALVHLPNPVLTVAGFFGGILSAYFFLKVRNLYILALAHGILGPSIRYLLDYTLRIGPGF